MNLTREANSESTHAFALKRSVDPYVGFAVILFGVTGLTVFVSLKTHSWAPLEAMPLGWLFFVVIVYIGTRYRILWRDGEVVQRASGGTDVSIRTDEITRIEQETSDVGTALGMRRPFRRITIYAEKSYGDGKFIDVSLKHFATDDVHKLMRAIQDRRPDLTLPKHWV
jgi:hypothetical protein